MEGTRDKTSQTSDHSNLEKEVKDLRLQRNILEAQVKFGVDSLRMEQEKVRDLEVRLSAFTSLKEDLASKYKP